MVEIIKVENEDDIEAIKELFLEYFEWLDNDICFPNFEDEVMDLPGEYVPPKGQLLLALDEDYPIGCIALKKHSDEVCEMKRLYVRDDFKGKGIGKTLIVRLIEEARVLGYKKIMLDTLPFMQQAIHLYYAFGFKKVENHIIGIDSEAIYMEMEI